MTACNPPLEPGIPPAIPTIGAYVRHPRLTALAALLAACGTADAREALVTIDNLPGGIPVVTTASPIDSGQWTLVHERDVQPVEGEPGELVEPQSVALAEDGTVYVVDQKPSIINVYGPDGAYLRSFGREGEGPGEFRTGFIAVRSDTLVLQDPQNVRGTTYLASDGTMLVARPTTCCYYAPISIDREGRVTARSMTQSDSAPDGEPFIRFALSGTAVESLLILEQKPDIETPMWTLGDGNSISMMITVPLQPQMLYLPHPSGQFVTGWAGEYRLRYTRNGQDTSRIFGRPWTPVPVTGDEKQQIVDRRIAQILGNDFFPLSEEQLRKSFDVTKLPDLRPAYESGWADGEGRIWMRLSSADTTAVHFDLFDEEGRWLDQVTIAEPAWATSSYQPLAFSKTHLAIALEGDDGLPVVRIYRIARSES